VLYCEHWFLFVVDLKQKMFLFLDSYFFKDDDYSVLTRRKLIPRFCHAWDMFVGSNVDFQHFKIAYPRVPKQSNTVDCGVLSNLWRYGILELIYARTSQLKIYPISGFKLSTIF